MGIALVFMITDAGLGASYSLLPSTETFTNRRDKKNWWPSRDQSVGHIKTCHTWQPHLYPFSVEEQDLDPKPHGTPT